MLQSSPASSRVSVQVDWIRRRGDLTVTNATKPSLSRRLLLRDRNLTGSREPNNLLPTDVSVIHQFQNFSRSLLTPSQIRTALSSFHTHPHFKYLNASQILVSSPAQAINMGVLFCT